MSKNKKARSTKLFFLLVVFPVLAIAISFYAILKGVQNYITSSDYFKIRDLRAEGIADARYVDLMREEILGGNIFRLDTLKLSEKIRRRFPTFYSVTVNRVLPSQLWIVAKERIPVAEIKRDLYYVFDVDGVVIGGLSSSGTLNLPLIVGLESQLPRIKIGTEYSLSTLRRALVLAKALRDYNDFVVSRIDASDPGNLVFYLADEVQIKIGDRDFENKISPLSSILHSIGGDLSNVKYIDLRPKEPVVATKNNVKNKKP